MLKIDAMNFSGTAADSWPFHDDLRIARRDVRELANAGESSAPVDASLLKQNDEDMLEIGRKRSEFLDLTDSSRAIRD
jgi:hypothetical protein